MRNKENKMQDKEILKYQEISISNRNATGARFNLAPETTKILDKTMTLKTLEVKQYRTTNLRRQETNEFKGKTEMDQPVSK